MKKLYILRGHSGSGKSTYSQELIKTIKQNFNNANITHINNDQFIIDHYGVYEWSNKNIQEAINFNKKLFNNVISQSYSKEENVFIINSNMNLSSKSIIPMIQKAKKEGFEVEIITFKNFFKNEHNNKDNEVVKMALKCELENDILENYINNSRDDKIKLFTFKKDLNQELENLEYMYKSKDILGSKTQILEKINKTKENILYQSLMENKVNKVKLFDVNNLPFNKEYNTYITKEFLDYGLIFNLLIKKQSEKYPELSVLKYSNKVFYDNLFNDSLLEMRGAIIDENANLIVRPFKKIFNYSEMIAENSKYPIAIHDNQPVKLIRKLNGYLGVATYVKKDNNTSNYNNKVLYSTTGSLDSSFALMTEKHLEKYEKMFKDYPNHSFMFEIMDENDPHIIKEQLGEALIGMIDVKTGEMKTEEFLDDLGKKYNIRRPETIFCTFGECKDLLQKVEHEGFMVYADNSKINKPDKILFKMKSPFYLITKLFGRMKNENLEKLLDKKNIDEEYYEVIEHIKNNLKDFQNMEIQDKISFVRNFLKEKYFSHEMKNKPTLKR